MPQKLVKVYLMIHMGWNSEKWFALPAMLDFKNRCMLSLWPITPSSCLCTALSGFVVKSSGLKFQVFGGYRLSDKVNQFP